MMLGFFGIGLQEIIVLLLGSVCFAGFVIPIVWLAIRSGKLSARVMELEEENRQMRQELERRERGSP